MRPKTTQLLKDEEKLVRREGRDSDLEKLDESVENFEQRWLGKDTSSSVKTVSGGRPESRRRKFKIVFTFAFLALAGD
jgi:hypothetical protein